MVERRYSRADKPISVEERFDLTPLSVSNVTVFTNLQILLFYHFKYPKVAKSAGPNGHFHAGPVGDLTLPDRMSGLFVLYVFVIIIETWLPVRLKFEAAGPDVRHTIWSFRHPWIPVLKIIPLPRKRRSVLIQPLAQGWLPTQLSIRGTMDIYLFAIEHCYFPNGRVFAYI